MASGEDPSNFIRKARRKLTEALLQISPELILLAADSHLLLTQEEFFSLSEIKDPQELVESLIDDTVLGKGEVRHELFLYCLENLRHVFPSLRPISEYLEDGPLNLRNRAQIQRTAVFPEKRRRTEHPGAGAEQLDAAAAAKRGNGEESLDPSESPKAGSEVDKPDASSLPLGAGSRVEEPDIPPSQEPLSATIPETSEYKEKESGAEDWEARAEVLELRAMAPEGGNEEESQVPSVSSEAGREVNSDTAMMPLEGGSRAEHINVPPSSGKDTTIRNLNSARSPEKSRAGTTTCTSVSSEKESGNENLDAGALDLDIVVPPERGNEVENVDPSVSHEAGSEADKPDTAIMPSETGSAAENANIPPSSTKISAAMNLGSDVFPQKGNRAKVPGASVFKQESAAEKLEAGAEDLDTAMPPERGNEAKNVDLPVSPETGTVLSSKEGSGVKNLDPPDGGNGAENTRGLEKERSEALQDILSKLKLEEHKSKKLSLQEVLEISSGSLKQCAPSDTGGLALAFSQEGSGSECDCQEHKN